MTGPKVLFYDIETSLQLVAVFQLGNNDWIDPSNLVTERYIICASWAWEGESKVHHVSVLDDPKRFEKDPYDDFHVVNALHKVLGEADVIVGHNSDSFDTPYVNTRALYHGLPALPPITSIDTYKVAKSKFRLNSNKLDYIGKFLKLGEKKKTSAGLWMRVLKGEKKAISEMVSYNKRDVTLLRDVFHKLVPYMSNHINRELFGKVGCPRCGSKKIQSRGYHRAISRVYHRFQCQACSGWFRSATNDKTFKTSTRVL
jgi:hypothetical protein